jgi:phage/plasmid-associated DNA primase
MTGGKCINARGLYETNTNTVLTGTIFMCSNELPKLDVVDDAIYRRLIVFNFKTLFKEEADLKKYNLKEGINEDGNAYYIADSYFKSTEFIQTIKLPMMNLLIQHFKKFKIDGYNIKNIPQSILANNKKYMDTSDNFISWFNSIYEKTDNKEEIIKLKDVYKNYQFSYLYENLTKQAKRNNNYNWFIESINNNIELRYYYKLKTSKFRNILTNYKIKEIDNDEINDYRESSDINENAILNLEITK